MCIYLIDKIEQLTKAIFSQLGTEAGFAGSISGTQTQLLAEVCNLCCIGRSAGVA